MSAEHSKIATPGKDDSVVITGIAGFIGFHFAKKLLNLGYRVIGIDNINAYYDVNLKLDRLKELGFSTAKLENIGQNNVKLALQPLKARQSHSLRVTFSQPMLQFIVL